MAQRANIPLDELRETCERFYERDGFVKWTDVAAAHGVSRQSIQIRFRTAVERGELAPEVVERWQSLASRRAATREREKLATEKKREREKHIIRVELTPENLKWLRMEGALKKVSGAEIVNGLIARARNSQL